MYDNLTLLLRHLTRTFPFKNEQPFLFDRMCGIHPRSTMMAEWMGLSRRLDHQPFPAISSVCVCVCVCVSQSIAVEYVMMRESEGEREPSVPASLSLHNLPSKRKTKWLWGFRGTYMPHTKPPWISPIARDSPGDCALFLKFKQVPHEKTGLKRRDYATLRVRKEVRSS